MLNLPANENFRRELSGQDVRFSTLDPYGSLSTGIHSTPINEPTAGFDGVFVSFWLCVSGEWEAGRL